jgi:ABC-type transporter Mla subunit MlaD
VLATDTHLARRVGTIALAVIGLATVFFVFIWSRLDLGSHVRIRVYFHTTGGLREGAPFVVGGRTVGRVETIALVPHGASKLLGNEDGIVLTVAIDSGDAPSIDRGGDVFIASRGALSAKYLELGPAPEPTAALKEGDELVGADPPSLDRVLQRTWDNLQTMGGFAAEIKPELDALRAQIDELRSHFDTTGGNLATLVPAIERVGTLIDDASNISAQIHQLREVGLGGEAGAARLQAVIARGRQMVGDARVSLDKLSASADQLRASLESVRGRLGTRGDEAIAKLELAIDRTRAVIAKVDPLLAQIDALNASLAAGDGSLMKLMHDPEFPEDAKELGKILKRHPWRVMDHPP